MNACPIHTRNVLIAEKRADIGRKAESHLASRNLDCRSLHQGRKHCYRLPVKKNKHLGRGHKMSHRGGSANIAFYLLLHCSIRAGRALMLTQMFRQEFTWKISR